jgi:hypothetical protein
LVCATSVGCAKVRRVRECNVLARGVNLEIAAIQAETAPPKRTPAAFASIAARYERMAGEVGRRRFADATLTEATKDYRELLERAGRACRQIASALPRSDTRGLESAVQDLDKVTRKEVVAVTRINAACHAP